MSRNWRNIFTFTAFLCVTCSLIANQFFGDSYNVVSALFITSGDNTENAILTDTATHGRRRHRRLILSREHHHEYTNLRFMAFGTSRTWGSGLKHRIWAYPYLLSKNASNLAIRAADATIPSLCTVSMVGDTMADVILLEYNLQATVALVRLANRLRQRFPKAVIIFLKVWLPFQFIHKTLQKTPKDMLIDAGYGTERTYSYKKLKLVLAKTVASDWTFYGPDDPSNGFIDQAREAVGGYIYELPRPDNALEALLEYGKLFRWDMTHYTAEGHEFMENAILDILRQVNAGRHDEVNPWASVDVCNSWFETGMLKDGTSPGHHPSMPMAKFGNIKKYALEATVPQSWIEVINPTESPMEVHVEYMVTDHPTIYPDVRVTLLNSLDTPHGVPIKPEASTITGLNVHIHIVKTARLGLASPGRGIIHIATLDKAKAKEHPFRVVGTILTPPSTDLM